VIPELHEPGAQPACGSPAGRTRDSAQVALRLAEDHDRIAQGLNDVVAHELFSAGLSLHAALSLIGDHRGAGKVREAICELDAAIRDLREMVSDRRLSDSRAGLRSG